MDHGTATANECKVSMMWNWDTVDSCFLSSSWQILNEGMMAASCIGVVFLVVILEFLVLAIKRFDSMVLYQMQRRGKSLLAATATTKRSRKDAEDCEVFSRSTQYGESTIVSPQLRKLKMRIPPSQQVMRAVLHAVTVGVAYVVVRLAMYSNGYIVISIIVGAGLGKFLCDWLTEVVEE